MLMISGLSWAACPTGTQISNGECVATNQTKSITAHTVCRRINNASGNAYFIPRATSAEWNSFLTNPPAGVSLSSCDCAAGGVAWAVSVSCNGNIPSIGSPDTVVFVNASGPNTGSANFKCQDGGWVVQPGAICVPPPANCASATMNWTVGSSTCSATLAATNHNVTVTGTDSTAPAKGARNFICNNGVFQGLSGETCASGCNANASQTWTVGSSSCTANLPALADGASTTISDSSGTDIGSATYTCNAGTLDISGQSCANALAANCTNVGGTFVSPNKCLFSPPTSVHLNRVGAVATTTSYPIQGDAYTRGGAYWLPGELPYFRGSSENDWLTTSMKFNSGKVQAQTFCRTMISGSYATAYSQAGESAAGGRFQYTPQSDCCGTGWQWSNNPYIWYSGYTGYSGPDVYPDTSSRSELSSVTCCLDSSCPKVINGSDINSSNCPNNFSTWGYDSRLLITDGLVPEAPACRISFPTVSAISEGNLSRISDPLYYAQIIMYGMGQTWGGLPDSWPMPVKPAVDQMCKQKFGSRAYAYRWASRWTGEDESTYAAWSPGHGVFIYRGSGDNGYWHLVVDAVCRSEN